MMLFFLPTYLNAPQEALEESSKCVTCGEPGAADDGLCDDCSAKAEPWTCIACGKRCEVGEDLCQACGALCCPACELELAACRCEPGFEDEP